MGDVAGRKALNGWRREALVVASAGAPYDDPLAKVFGLDGPTSGPMAWAGYFLGALALLWGLALTASAAQWLANRVAPSYATAAPPQEIDVLRDEPPPPPPPPEAEAKVTPTPPPAHVVPKEAPPPSPAQAARVLTREPDPNEPLDLTGNTIVSGNAEAYAGGVTAANGTSKSAVRGLTAPGGPALGTPAVTVAGPDRSRAPKLAGGRDWKCPFPPEADTAQIEEAFVALQIEVKPDGTPSRVLILSDPGNGFAREAVRCAMASRYEAALDRAGTAIAGSAKVHVRFSR